MLVEVAWRVSQARGYCAAVSQVHFFCPGEVMADALGIARSTLYLKLDELKAAELIDARGHCVTHNGRTKADGMVWAIKLHPERPGKIRVPYDALKHSYRCLSADIETGRTAWKQTRARSRHESIGQSKASPIRQVEVQKILGWALPPSTAQNPVTALTIRCDIEQVLDLPYVDREARGEAVDGAAQALAVGLGDAGGLMFYRWLLWQLLRLSDAQGLDYWHQVYEQARRARADVEEGFARKPGALFVSRLKKALWWEALRHQPSVRVASRRISV